jgi:2-polyprenyl-3-methyl-5-hydroxy-6-metoxy-1,4-benzoquinol methylase
MQNGQSVLDIGCGTGLITNLFAQRYHNSQFCAIDFSDAIDYAKHFSKQHSIRNVKFLKQDILTWKTEQTFDVVICQGVLHHIRSYTDAVERIKRLAKPGGMIIVGLYHPWGKILKKIININYGNEILRQDQEQNVYETAFSCRQSQNLFSGFELVASYPTVAPVISHVMALINSKSGGLVTYIWKNSVD